MIGTMMVHVPFAGIVPPVSKISFVSCAAVSAPMQLVVAPAPIVNPPGAPPIVVRLSLNDVMLAAEDEGLAKVIVRTLLLDPTATDAGKNALVAVGKATVSAPFPWAVLLPRLVTSPPICTLLFLLPAVRPLEAS